MKPEAYALATYQPPTIICKTRVKTTLKNFKIINPHYRTSVNALVCHLLDFKLTHRFQPFINCNLLWWLHMKRISHIESTSCLVIPIALLHPQPLTQFHSPPTPRQLDARRLRHSPLGFSHPKRTLPRKTARFKSGSLIA